MRSGFQQALDHIRATVETEAAKGLLFERLMRAYLSKDPVYQDRFSNIWLWSEWARLRHDFDGRDTGIDLVAEERHGGFCAIQCKCYAKGTRIAKPHLDSFISASARDPFTSRIVIDTGDEWGPNAVNTIAPLKENCNVLRFGDLLERPIDWPDLVHEEPEALQIRREPFSLRPHQRQALDDVASGFENNDRGKLIMACGTGKTFTALRIAEKLAGNGGRVLYLVPSISLFQQSMREWAEQRSLPHRYIGICSDTRAGRNDEDSSLQELEIPVTTAPEAITKSLHDVASDGITVVFCTYHSLGLIELAQSQGAPEFDLALCDEAHRTTGVEHPGDKTSPFVLVHDAERIKAAKRLYMTATSRIYTQGAKSKAASHSIEVFSMDDRETYGPELHRLPFSQAVGQNLLSDYKVVVFAMSEGHVDAALQRHIATYGGEINISDAAKIVGCWRALQDPENRRSSGETSRYLRRAIAFTNTIKASKLIEKHWDGIVNQAIALLPADEREPRFQCETRHVDGQHHALDRKARIEWLKGDAHGTCRILSNARCLSEGIDVPALDAVLFMNPRNSQVDIVQAVGRAMRKAPGKEYGYIVLPVAVPAGVEPEEALNDNERFAAVWGVLRALRSHDDRFDAEINKIDLNNRPTDRIIFGGSGLEGEGIPESPEIPFPPLDIPPGAIYAKIVEKCGDRKYWETWAKDVADIFSRLVLRINGLLDNPENRDLNEWFEAFHEELRISINDSINRDSAINMMAQHIITQPVFEALFEKYDFAGKNPVARALDELRKDFGEFGLENETRDLGRFYESVQLRARDLDNSEARQRVLMELYEKFFSTALKKDSDRLGIVYTPVEIVDFILASADSLLRKEFDRSLSDEGVHVLDPFTGTGIFLVRLLQSALVQDEDVERKFRRELHANEIVLLAYYIAAIHIEEAFHGRIGIQSKYEPFEGIVLTDTFNLHTSRTGFPKEWLPDNSARAERQQQLPIQVIVGNPPWSAGQRSSADENPNVDYPELDRRVAETYVSRSNATLKNSLYDTYKMAMRWASDRIGTQGLVAFVTNGSWIEANVDSGVRACFEDEFTSIHVMNLRGNQRTQGERSRREGGKVFGQGSRAPVAITCLVKNPNSNQNGCRIFYHDIGDYLSRDEKLSILRDAGSIDGVEEWQEITSDRHNDWFGQRDEKFQLLFPLGSKAVKSGKSRDALFLMFSNGYKSGRDAYVYNFSRDACAKSGRAMVDDYAAVMKIRQKRPEYLIDDVVRRYSFSLHWDDKLKGLNEKGVSVNFAEHNVRKVAYRPFAKQFLYGEEVFAQRPALTRAMFPTESSDNRAICVPGKGSTKPFSVMVVDHMPDLELISKGQCFPRYRFERGKVPDLLDDGTGLERIDNLSDVALETFKRHYQDEKVTKDALFDYTYGVLHSAEFRERFVNDLSKDLPRIPKAPDFWAFAKAGGDLMKLHLGYETCEEFLLDVVPIGSGTLRDKDFILGERPMRFADERKTTLIVNEHIRLEGIPPQAHNYQVNGRTPLAWQIDRYRVVRESKSGIVNDANHWFDNPRELVSSIQRIIHVSVETVRIVESLPSPFNDADA